MNKKSKGRTGANGLVIIIVMKLNLLKVTTPNLIIRGITDDWKLLEKGFSNK